MVTDELSLSPRQVQGSQLHWPGKAADRVDRPAYVSALVNDPFSSGFGSGMVTAKGDPFYEALVSGSAQGSLVLRTRSRGIPTFGAPRPPRRSSAITDRAILREIQTAVGGSFSSFVNNVFGSARKKGELSTADSREENPFARSTESAASEPSATKDSSAEPKAAAKPADPRPADPAPEQKQTDVGPSVPAGLVTTVRPQVMLHVGEDGLLQAFPAARLNDHTFESAELGIRQFDVLTFASPADIATSIAVADFNGDAVADVCFLDASAGVLRFFYGRSAGGYAESMRIEVGSGPRSLAAGDFDHDGRTEIAVSNLGIGTLTFVYPGAAEDTHTFRSFWLERYRDYIAAADINGAGIPDLIGMNFANVAEVLLLNQGNGSPSGRQFGYTPALNCRITTFGGRAVELNAVLLGTSLSLNLQDPQNQLKNVLNVQAGSGCYLAVGDLNYDNTVSLAVGTLKK